jgi:membrane protein involved in colicin uptake
VKLAELADLIEVIYAVVVNSGSTLEQFEKIRKKKQDERGGFEQRLLLISTDTELSIHSIQKSVFSFFL